MQVETQLFKPGSIFSVFGNISEIRCIVKIVSEGLILLSTEHQEHDSKSCVSFSRFFYYLFKMMFPILSRDDQKHQGNKWFRAGYFPTVFNLQKHGSLRTSGHVAYPRVVPPGTWLCSLLFSGHAAKVLVRSQFPNQRLKLDLGSESTES